MADIPALNDLSPDESMRVSESYMRVKLLCPLNTLSFTHFFFSSLTAPVNYLHNICRKLHHRSLIRDDAAKIVGVDRFPSPVVTCDNTFATQIVTDSNINL